MTCNLTDQAAHLRAITDIETGRDELEPHQIPQRIVEAAKDSDPRVVAQGLLDAAKLLDVNHAALRTRFQLGAAMILAQAQLLEGFARDAKVKR